MIGKNQNCYELATFAGGCFWCMVAPFKDIPGVIKVVSETWRRYQKKAVRKQPL